MAAAAYASLVTLARNLQQILDDADHMLRLPHGDPGVKRLLETVIRLLAAVENCPETARVEAFEARIPDYAYRAVDAIEMHFPNFLLGRSRAALFTNFWAWVNSNSMWMHPELRKLNSQAASLLSEARFLIKSTNSLQMKESPSVYSTPLKISAVGFDSDIAKVKEKLYGASSSPREVIPIVGMGGSGKTTLATILFDDMHTARRFDRRAWITVSQSYDRRTMLSQILRDLRESSPENAEYQDLGVKVFQTLKSRRYLIVIDDVWSEKLWDDIGIFLPDDGNGSRILLTTRLDNVATYVVGSNSESCYIHRVELLDSEMSWRLLKERVFGHGDCPVELEGIGKSIANDCGGLPLAIVVIAGVLSNANENSESWMKIAADVMAAIKRSSSENERVTKLLSLSYINLPCHLKPCFLYLACFPEDYAISVSKLVVLWVAEGFLKPSKSKGVEEEVAYEYLEDLVNKNLVLVSGRKYNGRIKQCRLHDLVRDLCVDKAEKENFACQTNYRREFSSNKIKNQIRFSFCSYDSTIDVLRRLPTECIRSTLYFPADRQSDSFSRVLLVQSFRLLRVLNAERLRFTEFPSQVCQLSLLRYLTLTIGLSEYEGGSNIVVKVPSSIRELRNLQVLMVEVKGVSGRFMELPIEIWEMSKLRHLIFPSGTILSDPPIETTSSLRNLQSLCRVVDFEFTEHVVQKIHNIKKLEIAYTNRSGFTDDSLARYSLRNLVHLSNLETLRIVWRIPGTNTIQLPHSLKKLSLFSCRLPWIKLNTVAGSLHNLEVMRLKHHACDGYRWEVKQGDFPKLRVLEIDDADLVVWQYNSRESSDFFPGLERLYLYNCRSLRQFPSCIGEIETLMLIKVDKCNKLLVEWVTEVQEEQESYGNEYLHIHITGRD